MKNSYKIIAEKLSYWKKSLGLDPWEIKVVFRTRDDMKCGGEAEVEISESLRRAIISILTPEEYEKYEEHNDLFPQDVEQTLVHELLHIPLESIAKPKAGTAEDIILENFVEQTAKALVNENRAHRDGA